MKLDGFRLLVIDMDKMVGFYQTFLGFNINYVKEHKNVYLEKDGNL